MLAALPVLILAAAIGGGVAGPMAGLTAAPLVMFGVALGIACATPGPTTTALVSRVLSRGRAGAPAFCAGLVLGDLFWLLCALFGIAAAIATAGPVFSAIRMLGAVYLLYLAWRFWTAPPLVTANAASVHGEGRQLAIGGLSITLGNPKTMLFYLALVPALLPPGAVTTRDAVTLSALVVFVYGAVLAAYVLLAEQLRRLLISPQAGRTVNRVSALVMATTAAFVALH